jgi:dihydrofolate synthase/folylpolyglutamate synthase
MAGYDEALAAIRGLTNYETMVRPPYSRRDMNLPRTRALLRRVGSPERGIPLLQVAGTKGKGTAAAALAAALGRCGRRVGLFTSPHLFDLRERIRVDGRWIDEASFARGVERMLPHVAPLRGRPECPTFFELMTVLAFLEFRRQEAEAAVLEVGLGGRLDATSAVRPLASLITSIGLDHTGILGRSKRLIAAEKAGVARRGVPLVSGVPPGSPAGRVIAGAAAERGSPLIAVGRDFRIRTGRPRVLEGGVVTPVSLRTDRPPALRVEPSVLGRALARDVGLAAVLLRTPRVAKRLPVEDEDLRTAFASLRVPGRMQLVDRSPLTLVDGAHNPDSARALVATVREAIPCRGVVAVVGGGADKGVPRTATALRRGLPRTRIVFTRPEGHPRAADPEELARGRRGAEWRPALPEAMELAENRAGPEDLLLVTGSLYLAGEALRHLGLAESGR